MLTGLTWPDSPAIQLRSKGAAWTRSLSVPQPGRPSAAPYRGDPGEGPTSQNDPGSQLCRADESSTMARVALAETRCLPGTSVTQSDRNTRLQLVLRRRIWFPNKAVSGGFCAGYKQQQQLGWEAQARGSLRHRVPPSPRSPRLWSLRFPGVRGGQGSDKNSNSHKL